MTRQRDNRSDWKTGPTGGVAVVNYTEDEVRRAVSFLFAHGAKRLQLRDKDERDQGGWCLAAAQDRVADALHDMDAIKRDEQGAPESRADYFERRAQEIRSEGVNGNGVEAQIQVSENCAVARTLEEIAVYERRQGR